MPKTTRSTLSPLAVLVWPANWRAARTAPCLWPVDTLPGQDDDARATLSRGAVMDIVVWLRSLGLGKYEAAFRENEIDETVLPT